VRRFSCHGLFAESFQITRSNYSHFVCLESFVRLVAKFSVDRRIDEQ
jgi:hypothetical protein